MSWLAQVRAGEKKSRTKPSSELGSSLGRAAVAGITAAAGAAVGGAVSMGTATYFAHRIITPEHEKKDDTTILDVDQDAGTVTFRANAWTTAPGRYGLWLNRGAGHARVGLVLEEDHDVKPTTVTRELLGVDQGEIAPGPARWNKYFFCGTPGSALGLDFEDVLVTSDIGDLAGWRVPPAEGTDNEDWAILVHGRSAMREETLRAVPVLHKLGYTSLIPMYRNDIGAPSSSDGRYSLGMSEWRDVDAAMRYALAHGARRLVLTGISSHQCVLFTANDAYVREYQLKIPRDCIAAPSVEQTRFALRYFDMVLSADTRASAQLRNWKAPRRRRRSRPGG